MKIIRRLKNITLQFQFHASLDSLFKRLKKARGIFIANIGKKFCKLRKIKRSRGRSLLTQSLLILSGFVLIVLTSCAPTADTAAAPPDNSTLLANLIKSSNPTISGLTITADNSDPSSPKINITGLTNNVSGDPATATIAIDQSEGITTIPASITVTAERLISPHTNTIELAVTFEGEVAVSYRVTTLISGAPVGDWFASGINDYTSAVFGSQGGALTIAESIISVTGLTNSPSGDGDEGMITFETLPAGFTAEPATITFPNPDGIETATSTPTPSEFAIIETENRENRMTYTVAEVTLAPLTRFTPALHIRITEQDGTDITKTLTFIEAGDTIRIEGMTNKLGQNRYTFIIDEMPTLFTTPGNAMIMRMIDEPIVDISPGVGPTPNFFAITNSGETEATMYALEVVFNGAPVSDWFTVASSATYITGATFAGVNSMMPAFDGTMIAISGGSTFANEPGETAIFTTTLPAGFEINTNEITSPLGDGFAAVTDASIGMITILETGNPNNSQAYPVTITLAAYNSPLTGIIAATYAGGTAVSSDIVITTTDIVISGFTNNDTGTPEMGAVTIDEARVRAGYKVTPLSLEITDPPGKTLTNVKLGEIIVTNTRTMREFSHSVTIRFDGDIQLRVEGTEITGSPLAVNSGDTIPITTVACQLLAAPTVTIVGVTGGKVSDMTPFPLYYDRGRDMPVMTSGTITGYKATRRLSLEDGSANALAMIFVITLEFPACESFAGGTGDDAATAYEIDNAPRLDLMSQFVNNDNANYGGKFYKITAAIDMSALGLPLSEAGSKTPDGMERLGGGFSPIGRKANEFSGTLDCASNTISGLYIKVTGADGTGLVGSASNATIKNCGLIDVNITGRNQVGGLVGYISQNSTISASYATGSVTGMGDFSGGLVGYSTNDSTISNSYATGSVTGMNFNVGGLVGYSTNTTISNSYATGSVTGRSSIGGLGGGFVSSTVSNSYATGSVTGMSSFVGGLFGSVTLSSSIHDSYATGSVTGMGSNVGGLVGENFNSSITNAYTTGDVSGQDSNVGLFIGYNSGPAIASVVATGDNVTASYFSSNATLTVGGTVQTDKKGVGSDDATASPPIATVNLTAQTTANLQSGTIYTGWDSTIWVFTSGQYPRLKAVVCANRQFVSPVPTDCMDL